MRSLLSNRDVSVDEIYQIFDLAAFYLKNGIESNLSGKLLFSIFFESSTRTETSFSVAASRLGCIVEKANVSNLATRKGEHLVDLISTLNAFSPDLFVIRHSESGVLHLLKGYIDCGIINAGDGTNEHPTQGLIDAFTILHMKEKIEGLNILICGDILRSRVAHSTIPILQRLGAVISISGPLALMPKILDEGIRYSPNFHDALSGADVVIMLRTQNERASQDIDNGIDFCLNKAALAVAKPDILIMHPGPVNRNREISDAVLNDSRNGILTQVRNGQYIRAAVISFLLEE
ncbi:aspartate/ornithine carbamoyltransferase, Asp/Orn binding domain protein [Neorickettsia helminthoeca str. Oregon]|uniref:Aspartate/ornithine carbamoyltransferase, Asp/Orn binding domain protein n=1 Tax=Neorickettsia helminthoeca str. Oregon TaxID=1286528 RepID=X5H4D3_9RICK|nr:aspartate carbamoyltransferase catalytic subunit [Neorickettsia helminthoeca]AHX11426.1 aspartate/ornithine carbamoyltransferase, Asp/Orn binding domain protein [Neorickettsia helminthoeca str. Oregon]